MGDPSTPHDDEDRARLLNEDDDSHGPGDLDDLPPSDMEDSE